MPRGHTQGRTLTPLGELIIAYIRQRYPVLETRADFARICGIYASTLDNVMYSQRHPSTRTLNKIINGTAASGYPIPANDVYTAARGIPVVMPPPPAPPMPRDLEQRRQPPRIAEQQSPYAELQEYSRIIQAFQLPDEVKRAMIAPMLEALQAAAGTSSAPVEPPPPWDDHEAVSTLQLPTVPAVPPARTVASDESQEEAQPAGACS